MCPGKRAVWSKLELGISARRYPCLSSRSQELILIVDSNFDHEENTRNINSSNCCLNANPNGHRPRHKPVQLQLCTEPELRSARAINDSSTGNSSLQEYLPW